VDPALLQKLLAQPQYDAIIAITLPAGFDSTDNNFSVVTTTFSPPPPPPQVILPPPPSAEPLIPPLPFFIFPVTPPPVFVPLNFLIAPVLTRAGGQLYTWHLSIVDAGVPRGDVGPDQVVQLTAMVPGDDSGWSEYDLSEGEFILPLDADDDAPVKA